MSWSCSSNGRRLFSSGHWEEIGFQSWMLGSKFCWRWYAVLSIHELGFQVLGSVCSLLRDVRLSAIADMMCFYGATTGGDWFHRSFLKPGCHVPLQANIFGLRISFPAWIGGQLWGSDFYFRSRCLFGHWGFCVSVSVEVGVGSCDHFLIAVVIWEL